MIQRSKNPEIKPGERIQTSPQFGEDIFRLTDLLSNGPKHSTNTLGLSRCGFEKPLEAPGLAKVPEQFPRHHT